LAVLLAFALLASITGPGLDARIASALPTAEENRWLEIPWRLSVAEARMEAQTSRKPMFLWVMNGHPMGCT
jgi:hypothetical protein